MSFQQGLSGLNASSKNLDTIGNNVANASTVGFKQSKAQFADMYTAAIYTSGDTQTGTGTTTTLVSQDFGQGNITSTNNPLDIAINGKGFFRLSTNDAITYSRNGQFQLDKTGYMVSASGARLTGYSASIAGVLSTGAPSDIKINPSDMKPKETANIKTMLNLDSRAIAKNLDPATGGAVFSPTDPTTYNNASSVSVYDSLGNGHILQTFYVKTHPYVDPTGVLTDPAGTAAQWNVYGTIDGTLLSLPDPAGLIGTLTFDTQGNVSSPATTQLNGSTFLGFMGLIVPVATGAQTPISGDPATPPGVGVNIDFSNTTQYGSIFGVNALSQDGYASGRLSGLSLNDDGKIIGRYTNSQVNVMGQVVLSNFANPNGLTPLGANQWAETSDSGQPLTGTPGSSSLGSVQSMATEDSNVDLTAELVNMITAQRTYQANAQTIKTQDQLMQTVVNLR